MQDLLESGGAGRAIIFMCSLVGLTIAGSLCLAYVAHALLVIMAESSVGDPEVRWPDESIVDWWWKPFYCLAMLSFWLTGGAAFLGWLLLISPWALVSVAGLFVWYAYPIGMLCVMDANNSMALVYLPLIVRLLQRPFAVLVVGLATLPLGAAAALFVFLVVRHGMVWVVPLAFVVPTTVLLYARAWGRLAWMLLNLKERKTRVAKEAPPAEAAHAAVHDPWALPPREEVPEVDVEVEEPPPEPGDDDEWSLNPQPYAVPATENAEAPAFSNEKYHADYRKREEARQARADGRTPDEKRRRRRPTLRNLFGPDFWQFLGDHRTLRVGLGIGLLTFVSLALARLMIETFPR